VIHRVAIPVLPTSSDQQHTVIGCTIRASTWVNIAAGLLVASVVACHPAPRPAAPPTDTDIIAKSHAVLAALDRGDVAEVKATLGEHYVHFDDGSFTDPAKELEGLAKYRPDDHIARRSWSAEHVFARGGDAIFIGRAKEHQAGNEVHGGYDFDGWYTLAWASEGDRWKLVYLGWQIAGAVSQVAVWNQIYQHSTGFNHAPNKLLAEYAATHAPGTAVDVTMGQGRNALYLAATGWQVTGVDISDEGVRQAREAAAQKHLTLDAIVADVTTFDYGSERYDLVAMIYAWPAIPKIAELQRATRNGGLFIYEYFAPGDRAGDAPAPGALAKQFAGWEILRDEIVDEVPDFAADRAKIQRFVARKK
jgi:SAM-dependent methyltransferase